MGNALYRKYRSSSLDEVIGQDHITTTLKNSLKTGKISHAYLFTGPRGVGKTSIARILAREVNNLPESTTEHLDIIEIDAASNRRIDEIRDLREKAQIAPSNATYKVYIIDEVHMLTKEAFNALLKTLEEPPKHVIFILATTELHKLPETIVSRTQRFTFKPIEVADAVDHLKQIAKKEKIAIDTDALSLLAEHGRGSFRDSLSFLDQIRHIHSDSKTKITIDDVASLLGLPPRGMTVALVTAIEQNDIKAILTSAQQLQEKGIDAAKVARELSAFLRGQFISSGSTDSQKLHLLRDLIEVQGSSDPYGLLELVLLQSVTVDENKTRPETAAAELENPNTETEEVKPVRKTSQPIKPSAQSEVKVDKKPPPTKSIDTSSNKSIDEASTIDDAWKLILEELKGRHNTLYGMARMAIPKLDGNECILECRYNFHAKRLSDSHHKSILVSSLNKHLNKEVALTCTVTEKRPAQKDTNERPSIATDSAPKQSLEAISNIFGDAEVLES